LSASRGFGPVTGQIHAKRRRSFFATFFSKKVVLTCLTFFSCAPAFAQTTLTLSATGQAAVTPDQVTAALTAQGNSRNMATAQNQVNTAMEGALALAKDVAGVTATTANYAVAENQPDSGPVTYQASQELDLQMTAQGGMPPARFSALLAKLQDRGFLLQNFDGALSDSARRAAEQAAIRDAISQIQAQAEAVAAALGERAGRVESVNVNGFNRPPMPELAAPAPMMARAFSAPQAAPSSVQVQVDVNAVVDLVTGH